MHTTNLTINNIIKIIILLIIFSLPLSTTITNVFLTLFMLLWIVEGNYKTKLYNSWQCNVCIVSILMLISLAIGSLYSYATWLEIIMFLKKPYKLIYIPFLIYYFKDPDQRKWTINALIISSTITTIFGLLHNSYQPFKNSIDTSLLVTIAAFLLLHKIEKNNKLYINIIILITSLFNIFYLFYISQGRTAQLIFLLLMPLFFIQKMKNYDFNKIAIILIALVLIFSSLFSSGLQNNWRAVITQYKEYIDHPDHHSRNSISERLTFYKNSLILIKQKPWLGWGTASFIPAYKQLAAEKNILATTNPHNEYLLWGTQLGIVGVSLLLWWLYSLFKISFIIPNYEKYMLQGVTLCIAIGSLANSWLMDFVSGHVFVMLIAISLGTLPDVKPQRIN